MCIAGVCYIVCIWTENEVISIEAKKDAPSCQENATWIKIMLNVPISFLHSCDRAGKRNWKQYWNGEIDCIRNQRKIMDELSTGKRESSSSIRILFPCFPSRVVTQFLCLKGYSHLLSHNNPNVTNFQLGSFPVLFSLNFLFLRSYTLQIIWHCPS